MKYVKPYLRYFILAPILMVVEVIGEVVMPKFLANIIDVGIPSGDASYIVRMGLLMAGCYPELFRAVSVFVPVTDLKKWHSQNENYAPHIKACCKTKAEMTRRSPVSFIDGIAKANVKIFAGKYDKTIPVAHSEDLYRTIRTKYPDAKIYLDTFDGGHEMDM